MKETVKCSRALGQLEKMFRQLNQDKFGGELEIPIITIQNTPKAYGHVTCGKVWKRTSKEDIEQYELNIDAGSLNRPIEDVVSTLLHEMVHIFHLQNNIQDCSRGCTYHNKKFKAKAESVGLIIEYDSKIGYSITSPSDELILYICDQGWEDIKIGRSEFPRMSGTPGAKGKLGNGGDDSEKRPSSTRKYICPCCGVSVRATKTVNIKCADCEEQMVVAS